MVARLRHEVARNPDDFEAGLRLGSALYRAGDPAASALALSAVLVQQPDHPGALLLLARAQARCGRSEEALETFARVQRVNPADPQGWQVAAALAADTRAWAELLRVAGGWIQRHPRSREAWQALSRAHFEESRFAEAIAAYEGVLELEPREPANWISAARLAIAAQDYGAARRHLETAQQLTPNAAGSPELCYAWTRLMHLTGDLVGAEAHCRQALKARPEFVLALVELGALRQGQLEQRDLESIKRLAGDPAVHPEHQVMLGFTLGDALAHAGADDRAFDAWDQANQLNRRISEREGIRYRPEQVEREPELLAALFAEPLGSRPVPRALGFPRPIFVVGMPRSGTTLIESILAAHSTVYGAGELPTLLDLQEQLLSIAELQGVAAAREYLRVQAAAWRQRYLRALPPSAGASSVVDKQPLNFRSIGLIRLLFPESPIIYASRPALDVGLSIYRHKFSKSWPCAHRLEHIGHYYSVHARIVAHWQQRYPDAIQIVDHTALVEDPETGIRRLLASVNLAFEPACLAPHQTQRPIATFSAVQVRQPVSAAFCGRAQRYLSRLAPLREALGSDGD